MYDYLLGKPGIWEAGLLTLEVGGIGYEILLGDVLSGEGMRLEVDDWERDSERGIADSLVNAPTTAGVTATTSSIAMASVAGTGLVRVYIHYYKTEQKTVLYGFRTRLKRDVFRLLLQASGVGPSSALNILLDRMPQVVLTLLVEKDKEGLTAIKGLGERTAGKMLLELAKKAEALLARYGSERTDIALSPARRPKTDFPLENDLRSALSQLDYKEHEINRVLVKMRQAGTKAMPENIEEALRSALNTLGAG